MALAKGTQKLAVKEKVGSSSNYICCFRGSKALYGADGVLTPADATGIFLATGDNGLGAGFPTFDTAELLRKGIIYDVNITYKDGAYTKSHRVMVAKSKLQTFLTQANNGTLKFNSSTVTSGSVSQTAVTHL